MADTRLKEEDEEEDAAIVRASIFATFWMLRIEKNLENAG